MRASTFLAAAICVSSALAQWEVDPPTTADPNTPEDCTWWHVAATGDSCSSIPEPYYITEAQFRSYNPTLATACSLVIGNSYCVERNWGIPPEEPTTTTTSAGPTTTSGNGITTPTPTQSGMVGNCNRFYWVEVGDSCADIASQHGISLSNFYSWNPAIGTGCGGLWAEVYVCVGIVGSTPSTTLVTTTTTTGPGNGIETPQPTQPGMVSNCNRFAFVEPGSGCQDIASANGISLTQFLAWNTEVGSNCGGLWAEVYVCVGIIGWTPPATTTTSPPTTTGPGNGITTPTPTQPGMVSNCNRFAFVESGSGCSDIAAANGISLTQFNTWNPQVGASCGGLWAEVYVCVGIIGFTPTTTTNPPTTTTQGNGINTPTPTQSGMVSNCDRFHFVNSGQGCSDIATLYGIPLSNFYSWNPAVGNNCQGLWANVYVCVRTIGFNPPPTTTTTGNGVATPTPIQPGMSGRCNRFHLVVSGDTCENIASRNSITLSNFYSWNPGVGTSCQTLWGGYYVCTRVF